MMSDLKRHFLSFARMKRQLFETAVFSRKRGAMGLLHDTDCI